MEFEYGNHKFLCYFKQFVDELSQNNSRLYKMEVLKKWAESEAVLYFLNFLYNPYIVTGISDKKLKKDVGFQLGTHWLDYPEDSEIFEYVKEHNTGRDVDIWTVQRFRESHIRENLRELFDKIITKSLSLGIDVLTINKCIPNLIPTFNVQLANKYFEKPEIVKGKHFGLTTKIDGGRIIALKENGQVSFYTRAGQKYEGLVDLEEEFKTYFPDNLCFDGEITLLNKGNLTSKEQYKETMKITRKDGEKHGVKMLVFDCMSAYEFKTQFCDTPYYIRRRNLEEVMSSASLHKDIELREQGSYLKQGDRFPQYFEELPVLYDGDDPLEIINYLNEAIENGEEGVMINIWDAPYSFKRTNDLLKVKKMNDIDLPILDFEEGTGKNKGKLGALITEYKGFILKVGSGLTDELREKIWNNKEDYRGLTMSIQYFEETTNQEGGISLRFPVFLDFRTDK